MLSWVCKQNGLETTTVVFTYLTSDLSKSTFMYFFLSVKIVLMANFLQWMGLHSRFALVMWVGMKLGQAVVTLPHLRITFPTALCPRGV